MIANKKQNTNIPPLINDGVYVSNFKEKAKLFNEYFVNQCTTNDNGSVLPRFISKTEKSLSQDIVKIIYSPRKAHGCNGISVSMLKLCAVEIDLPLFITFRNCMVTGKFPDSWKYANVQPIHKKENRQIIRNYRPISLLPICGKIFEKIVFDQVYTFLNVNNLSINQSGFRPGYSTIYQFLSITSSIYQNFENYDACCILRYF